MLLAAAKIGTRQARDGPWVIKSVLIEEKRWRRQENYGKRGKSGKKEVCSVIRIRACSEFVQVLHDANEKKCRKSLDKPHSVTYDYKGSSNTLKTINLIPLSTSYKGF